MCKIRIILKGVVYNIHKYRTRYNNNLHPPIVNLSEFNKEAYFSGKKVFNHLTECIKNLSNDLKCFTFFYHIPFTRSKNILNIRKTKKYKKLRIYIVNVLI